MPHSHHHRDSHYRGRRSHYGAIKAPAMPMTEDSFAISGGRGGLQRMRSYGHATHASPENYAGGPAAYAEAAPQLRSSAFEQMSPPMGLNGDGGTAIFDMDAHTITFDGKSIEAHSGLGASKDDGSRADRRNEGPAPPGTYDVSWRKGSFHGVKALRLTPEKGTDTFGRGGLLAHSYMLGPNGDSNGCISIKDFPAFQQAVAEGKVSRIQVVSQKAVASHVAFGEKRKRQPAFQT